MSELEQQTDELHRRLRASSQPDSIALSGSAWAAANDLKAAHTDNDHRLASIAPFFRQDSIAPVSFRSFPPAPVDCLQTPESLPQDLQSAGTLSRSLDGQSLDPKDVDALFQL